MNNIISIQPTEKVFSITWMLGRRCNYDCMYCPPELHDKFSKHHDLLKLKEAWQNIHNQTAKKKQGNASRCLVRTSMMNISGCELDLAQQAWARQRLG
jgi:hypothetical protein